MKRDNEIELRDAAEAADLPEEVVGRMAEEGKLKSRPADGTIYFVREEIEQLIARQIEEIRSTEEA
ncbi:MAG: hypothetical protein WBF09_08920 [Candidatus Acidiferrum sp.]